MEIRRDNLIHVYGMSADEFCKEIEKTGGWPEGATYVSFFHAIESKGRICVFGNQYLRTEWWTTVLCSDDYYWWKISDARKRTISLEAKREILNKLSRMEL